MDNVAIQELDKLYDLKEALYRIRTWHMQHNLPVPGVMFVYEKPGDQVRANQTIKHSFTYHEDYYHTINGDPTIAFAFDGVPLKLLTQEPRY